MKKQLILKNRRRMIEGSFSFIPHRFLREGFFECLQSDELILYFFLCDGRRRARAFLL